MMNSRHSTDWAGQDSFETIGESRSRAAIELKVQGSRFLGFAFDCTDLDGARQRIAQVRRDHHDATHCCWAARFLVQPGQFEQRSDDDGEPGGTAGPPILAMLEQSKLANALVIVVRYYGGTKLGTGGLARAYSEAARAAIDAAARRTVWWRRTVTVDCAYDDLGAIESLIRQMNRVARLGQTSLIEVHRSFDEQPRLICAVLASAADSFCDRLRDTTGNRAKIEID